jgi:lipopolysaccharide/colanic/teichoic acid biosynthesis glycosyltransferase
MATLPILRESTPAAGPIWKAVDVCERGAALVLLVAAAPVLAGSALTVWALSGHSPWIAHRRVGWRGETLWMIKLRTMWDGRERQRGWIEYIADDVGPDGKSSDDPRVRNRFASFCRRHSIDELPQLWHVVRGEMSLVGPRPMTARELRRHYGDDAEELLEVKPGMAGLWQISGRNRLTYAERRELDLRFVRNRSLKLYGQILLRTLPEVWRGANSW